MCVDMRTNVCIHVCVDRYVDMCSDMCIDMCSDMRIDVCVVSWAYYCFAGCRLVPRRRQNSAVNSAAWKQRQRKLHAIPDCGPRLGSHIFGTFSISVPVLYARSCGRVVWPKPHNPITTYMCVDVCGDMCVETCAPTFMQACVKTCA